MTTSPWAHTLLLWIINSIYSLLHTMYMYMVVVKIHSSLTFHSCKKTLRNLNKNKCKKSNFLLMHLKMSNSGGLYLNLEYFSYSFLWCQNLIKTLRNFKNREVKFYLSFFLFQKKKHRHFAAKTVSGVEFKMVQTLTIINCKNENAHHPKEGFF